MVRHIIFWKMKETDSPEQRFEHAKEMKQQLEALKDKITGIVSIQVAYDLLPGSCADVVLDSAFESKAALDAYQEHPEHLKVKKYVHNVVQSRSCVDYEA